MTATPESCFHLTVDIVREIHAAAIDQFGGSAGLRDLALLESAVAAPQASFGGQSPYADCVEIAAAYLFYLCRNHPFVDGNKRAAFLAVGLFLFLNNHRLTASPSEATLAVLALAAGEIDDAGFARWLRTRIEPRT